MQPSMALIESAFETEMQGREFLQIYAVFNVQFENKLHKLYMSRHVMRCSNIANRLAAMFTSPYDAMVTLWKTKKGSTVFAEGLTVL